MPSRREKDVFSKGFQEYTNAKVISVENVAATTRVAWMTRTRKKKIKVKIAKVKVAKVKVAKVKVAKVNYDMLCYGVIW